MMGLSILLLQSSGIPVEAVRSRSERVCKTGGDIKIEGLDVGASR